MPKMLLYAGVYINPNMVCAVMPVDTEEAAGIIVYLANSCVNANFPKKKKESMEKLKARRNTELFSFLEVLEKWDEGDEE